MKAENEQIAPKSRISIEVEGEVRAIAAPRAPRAARSAIEVEILAVEVLDGERTPNGCQACMRACARAKACGW